MVFNVTTFIEQKEVKSEDIKIQNKLIYGVLNKYIRAKENKEENFNNKVVNF